MKGRCVTDPGYDAVNNCFERSLVWMHKMPRVRKVSFQRRWKLNFKDFLMREVSIMIQKLCLAKFELGDKKQGKKIHFPHFQIQQSPVLIFGIRGSF